MWAYIFLASRHVGIKFLTCFKGAVNFSVGTEIALSSTQYLPFCDYIFFPFIGYLEIL